MADAHSTAPSKRRNESWSADDIAILKELYPRKGKRACMFLLNRTEAQIRWKASELRLKAEYGTPHFREWQKRAALSKVGKKRPLQAIVIRRLHAEGKLPMTDKKRQRLSKSIRKTFAQQGHPRGALGMRHTEETKNRIAATSKTHWESLSDDERAALTRKQAKGKSEKYGNQCGNRPHGSWKAGWREIGGQRCYFRSRWEANYARYLEWLKVHEQISSWSHEPETFWFDGIKRGCVSYLPDFKVTDNGGLESYHEVKGWMDSRSKTTIRRMGKYHPGIKLVVIDGKQYRALERQIGKAIVGWEFATRRQGCRGG